MSLGPQHHRAIIAAQQPGVFPRIIHGIGSGPGMPPRGIGYQATPAGPYLDKWRPQLPDTLDEIKDPTGRPPGFDPEIIGTGIGLTASLSGVTAARLASTFPMITDHSPWLRLDTSYCRPVNPIPYLPLHV